MKTLVTGGVGFIGSALTARLVSEGYAATKRAGEPFMHTYAGNLDPHIKVGGCTPSK